MALSILKHLERTVISMFCILQACMFIFIYVHKYSPYASEAWTQACRDFVLSYLHTRLFVIVGHGVRIRCYACRNQHTPAACEWHCWDIRHESLASMHLHATFLERRSGLGKDNTADKRRHCVPRHDTTLIGLILQLDVRARPTRTLLDINWY